MLMATKYKFDMQDARREGIEEGIRQGIETGIAKGIKQGIETGIRQGKLESIEKNIAILRSLSLSNTEIYALIKKNFDIDEKVLRELLEG